MVDTQPRENSGAVFLRSLGIAWEQNCFCVQRHIVAALVIERSAGQDSSHNCPMSLHTLQVCSGAYGPGIG
jgi:hypothetical protein